MTFTPLERLGLEVAAFRLLGSRAKASLLMALLDANGRTCGWEALARARSWRLIPDDRATETRRGMAVRISVLRSLLEDAGIADVIHGGGGDRWAGHGDGYSLPEPGRTKVLERLIEVAS